MDIWMQSIGRLIALALEVIGILTLVGFVIHGAAMIVAGAAGGSGRLIADAVGHGLGALAGLGLALSAPRIVEALMTAAFSAPLF
jgi:hypothetical protein